MPFKDIFLPAWQRSNPVVRLRAVQEQVNDDRTLAEIIKTYREEREIKLAAVAKLRDESLIGELVFHPFAFEVAPELLDRIGNRDFLKKLLKRAQGNPTSISHIVDAMEKAIQRFDARRIADTEDSEQLLQLVARITDGYLVREAVIKVSDPGKLAAFIMERVRSSKELADNYRYGLKDHQKKESVFACFDLEILRYFAKYPEFEAVVDKSLRTLEHRLEVKRWTEETTCPECKGSGRVTYSVQVPYTDHDWEEEEGDCSYCEGGIQRTEKRSWSIIPLEK